MVDRRVGDSARGVSSKARSLPFRGDRFGVDMEGRMSVTVADIEGSGM